MLNQNFELQLSQSALKRSKRSAAVQVWAWIFCLVDFLKHFAVNGSRTSNFWTHKRSGNLFEPIWTLNFANFSAAARLNRRLDGQSARFLLKFFSTAKTGIGQRKFDWQSEERTKLGAINCCGWGNGKCSEEIFFTSLRCFSSFLISLFNIAQTWGQRRFRTVRGKKVECFRTFWCFELLFQKKGSWKQREREVSNLEVFSDGLSLLKNREIVIEQQQCEQCHNEPLHQNLVRKLVQN